MKHVLARARAQQTPTLPHATLEPSMHEKKPSSEIDELSSLSRPTCARCLATHLDSNHNPFSQRRPEFTRDEQG